eukprot:6038174-Pyramimonas_sp.AAC.1
MFSWKRKGGISDPKASEYSRKLRGRTVVTLSSLLIGQNFAPLRGNPNLKFKTLTGDKICSCFSLFSCTPCTDFAS